MSKVQGGKIITTQISLFLNVRRIKICYLQIFDEAPKKGDVNFVNNIVNYTGTLYSRYNKIYTVDTNLTGKQLITDMFQNSNN